MNFSIWVWIVILVIVGLVAFFTVSPAPAEPGVEDPADPPPGSAP